MGSHTPGGSLEDLVRMESHRYKLDLPPPHRGRAHKAHRGKGHRDRSRWTAGFGGSGTTSGDLHHTEPRRGSRALPTAGQRPTAFCLSARREREQSKQA